MRTTIFLPKDKNLLILLEAEQGTFRHKRASYTLKKSANQLIAEIEAEDASALKATVSSICRVITVYEKARKC